MSRLLNLVITVLVVLSFTGGSALASSGSKNVNVHYDNIKLQFDGNAAATSSEPFILNGVTYIPLRDLATLTGLNVEWDGTNRIIKLSHPGTIAESNGSTITPTHSGDNEETTKLAELLCSKYGHLADVTFEKITLSGNRRDLKVVVQLDLTNELTKWNGLTDRDIEIWLSQIVKELQQYYSSGTDITGSIINKSSGGELVSFTKEGARTLMVQYFDGSYRKGIKEAKKLSLETEYMGTVFFVNNIKFFVTNINYQESQNILDITLTSSKSGDFFDWESYPNSIITRDTINNCKDIDQAFRVHANVYVEQINLQYYDKTTKFLDSYIYDVKNNKIVTMQQHKTND